jgi:transcriptional regulator with XRE-family HTH domain
MSGGEGIIVIGAYGAIASKLHQTNEPNSKGTSSSMTTPLSARKVHLVGSRIRELRKGRRLTQTELSEKIGVAQSDLSRMEQGEYKVGLDTLFKILQVFDLKMGEFFGETSPADEAAARELVTDFETLSADARREVRDFVRFKKMQEQEVASSHPEAEAEAPSAPEHAPLTPQTEETP